MTYDFLQKRALPHSEQPPPPAKRARSGEGLDGQEAELLRDEKFWFEDGTIVLIAGNVEFRVYKGVLTTHSPIFADMFSLPQPQSSSTSQSPVPQAVYLSDSPEDLRILLRAILPHEHGIVVHKRRQHPSFDEISAYARLGHKYQIDLLVEQALDYLKAHFIDDFDKWCNQEYVPPMFKKLHSIGVVNIARLTACDSILPLALAVCSTLDPTYLLDGFKREDGTSEKLSHDDILRCLRAKETLMQEASCAMLRAFEPFNTADCPSPGLCQAGLQRLLHNFATNRFMVADDHPFRPWEAYADWFGNLKICALCQTRIKDRIHSEQHVIWRRLPQILDIDIKGWQSEPHQAAK